MSRKIVEPIHIVGLGCAGMRVARALDELGGDRIASTVHLWDGDSVEDGNVRSQLYLPEHVERNMKKVDAARELMSRFSSLPIVPHPEYVDESHRFSGIVVVCVDTMSARKNVFRSCVRDREHVSLMVETRLETEASVIHVLYPSNEEHCDVWERRYWYPDDEVTTQGSCGAATSFGPISSVTAEIAVWQIIRHAEIQGGADDALDNQIRTQMRPFRIETFRW